MTEKRLYNTTGPATPPPTFKITSNPKPEAKVKNREAVLKLITKLEKK